MRDRRGGTRGGRPLRRTESGDDFQEIDARSANGSTRKDNDKWSGRRGSNPRPTAWEAVTLPLSYSRPLASEIWDSDSYIPK